jgi:hypothetical protein
MQAISAETLAARLSDEERLRVAMALIRAAYRLCPDALTDNLAAFSQIERLRRDRDWCARAELIRIAQNGHLFVRRLGKRRFRAPHAALLRHRHHR